MYKNTPIFSDKNHFFCSVPVPSINAHKGGSFDFTQEQMSKYGQSQTHPSILYFENGWNGHKYWLCTTPYPSGVGVFENPCIYYGDEDSEGNPPRVFTAIANNPVTKVPNNSTINSDPDIIVLDGTMYLLSRENTHDHAVFMQKSTNGTTWTERPSTPLWSPSQITNMPELISPSFIKIGNYIYAYCCTGTVGTKAYNEELNEGMSWGIHIMRGTNFENGGDFQFYKIAHIVGNRRVQPWHMDIFEYNGKYYIICCATKINESKKLDLYLAESTDGITFKMYSRPIASKYKYYRPSAFVRNDGLLVLYWSVYNVAELSSDRLPNGNSDLSADGRYIGVSYMDFQKVINELKQSEKYNYPITPIGNL